MKLKFTIGTKIRLGFLLAILIFISVTVYTYFKIVDMDESYITLINQKTKISILAEGMKSDALEKIASLRGVIASGDKSEFQKMIICENSFNEKKATIEKLLVTTEGTQALSNLVGTNDQLNNLTEKIKLLMSSNSKEELQQLANRDVISVTGYITQYANSLSIVAQQLVTKETNLQSQESRNFIRSILLINIVVLVLLLVIAELIARFISKPLVRLKRHVEKVAGGDLTVEETHIKSRDEVGELARSLDKMVENFRVTVGRVKSSSNQVAASAQELMAGSESSSSSSEEISASIQNVSESVEKQKISIDNISSTINEVSAGIEQTAGNIQSVSTSTLAINKLSIKGQDALTDVINQIGIIDQSSMSSVNAVKSLGEMSRKVESIISLISEISNQTNLLALNAAIEAARAGEHGRGFSVVADEVRKLAEQSNSATQEIAGIIKNMGNEISTIVSTIESGASEVKKGIEIVNQANSSFHDISIGFEDIMSQTQEVSAATEQMTAGTQQVVAAVEEVLTSAIESTTSIQEITSAMVEQSLTIEDVAKKASELSRLANELDTVVSVFVVK